MSETNGTCHGQNARACSGEDCQSADGAEGWGSRERRWSRRPIESDEAAVLEALGRRLAEVRRSAKLTQAALAERSEVSVSHLGKLEAGARRTRASTLARVAAAIEPNRADDLARELIALAGDALATESDYADRVNRRRSRRFAQRRRKAAAADPHAEARPSLALVTSARIFGRAVDSLLTAEADGADLETQEALLADLEAALDGMRGGWAP